MKTIMAALVTTLAAVPAFAAGPADTASALASRIVPTLARDIVFETIDSPADTFAVSARDGKVLIEGNNAGSMAVGLNNYLRRQLGANVSWFATEPVQVPDAVVLPEAPYGARAAVGTRFFLNYCTFGYTMPWWQWREWERFIDWMALQGINLPLAITGQEAVWMRVFASMGVPENEIRDYFTGPAHLPWHRMSNLDKFQGGLPDSWLKHQEELQKQIVARERELGMKPVLPAFSGHVPEALVKVRPDAKIIQKSQWCGFRDCFRSFFLDSSDPLFAEIQKRYLDEQTRLYGTDHIYGIDPFNEVDPPSWEPTDLAATGEAMCRTLTDADPEAIWLQMTWLFYQAKKKWTPERVEAYVKSIPAEHSLLLDYYCDRAEVWKQTDAYFGKPYLWCYLGNFGGNTMLAGDIAETGRRIDNVLANGGENCQGIGSTLEALDVNPVMYEYVFEKAWDGCPDDAAWMQAWADRRTGSANQNARKAWASLYDNVYNTEARLGQATLTNARPGLESTGTRWTKPTYKYDNAVLFDAWTALIDAAGSGAVRDSHEFDIVNVGRQVLGNHFKDVRDRFSAAYKAGDAASAAKEGATMLALLDDIDELLSCHSTFSFGRWLDGASAMAADDTERDYYLTNACTLLSTWGERDNYLNDYANRAWSGLMKNYYKPRWQMFVDDVLAAMAKGQPFDEDAFKEKVMDFEIAFATTPCRLSAAAKPDAVDVGRRLAQKYRPAIAK